MKKFNINSVTQGLIITILGFIADIFLLGLMLYKFKIENTAIVVILVIIGIIILYTINDLIKERNRKWTS